MANIKKALSVNQDASNKFSFDTSFKSSFDGLMKAYSDALSKLNSVVSGKDLKSEYGVCCCSYKLRYVTPNDMSTYISNLVKGLETGLFEDRINDIELFTVASVKRFVEDNGCPTFESSAALDSAHNYVNPSECTLHDLACICENDIGHVAVYSRGEMLKRLEFIKDDVKKMNEMHFAANMKKIVAALPSVLEKSSSGLLCNKGYSMTLRTFIEEFILFVSTLNTIAVLQLIAYAKPSVSYTTKQKEENSQDLVTECCLANTTSYMIRSNLPFNCNMRDVVLQDVTPDFKDVHDAMHFIMKDPRSPISILVNKFASKEDIQSGEYMIGQMFTGLKHFNCHPEHYYNKATGCETNDPRETDNFETTVDWLDTIAFGNNYLDDNFRRDGVGNNAKHPISNTLDMIYRIFCGCDLKTNEDIANNLVRVCGTMRSIIHSYKNGEPIENYDLTKNILVVLGEIFTRNMLRLYYNNTHVMVYDDDMSDTMIPGFICTESYVMEADTPTDQTNNANTGNNNGGQNGQSDSGTVTFTNAQGQQLNNNNNSGNSASNIISKIIDWIKNQLSKFGVNFAKKYKSFANDVAKNKETNDAIKKAIQDGSFIPNLTNMPKYQFDKKRHIGLDKAGIEKLFDLNQEYKGIDEAWKILNVYDAIKNDVASQSQGSNNNNSENPNGYEMIENYFLYGKTKPETITGKMTPELWDEICNDLTNCIGFVENANNGFTKTITDASDVVKAKAEEANKNNNEALKTRCNEITKSIQVLTGFGKNKGICQKIIEAYGTKFFNDRYKLYRKIFLTYKQQTNNAQQNQQTTQNQAQPQPEANTANTGETPPAAPAAEQAPANQQ